MRKAYILKRLTGQVKRLAAFMLITLMAVGNAFAEEVTFVFSEQGYENATELVSGTINDYISFVAGKGEASNPPKYYNTGSAIRFYSGSGNGNFITLIPAAGYQINGISVNENAGNTGNMGFIADGGEAVVMTPSGNVCAISGLNAVEGVKCYNAVNSTSGHIRIASITITYSEVGSVVVETPTFSVPAGSYYTPQTVSLSCATTGANIYYSINGGDAVLYNAPFTVSATTTVSACAVLGEDTSAVATANYVFPVEVANIAAFKAGTENQLYHITGDVNYVFRNGKNLFVQDATGGLLIYDNTPYTITTEYQEGDVISGLYGTLVEYNGIMEMYPTLNTAEGVAGSVTPVEVTVAELLANPAQYVSNLVLLRDGQFAAGSFNTSAATNVNFSQNGSTIVVRNNYKTVSATFTGGESASVVGLVTLYNGVPQLYPRSNADIITNALPFTCSFENNSGILWTLVNGENANKWYIGEAAGFDNSKLYISSSNGLTNKYNVSAASVSHAYMDVTLPASDVLLTFDVRSMGEANDFLQVSLLDEAPEAGVLPATSLTRIYNVGEFSTKTILIPASYAGAKKLVFTWSNNNANGTQTPAAIDNVKMESTCTQVSNIAATVEGHTATITWNAPEDQNAWEVQYKAANADAWQTVNASSASVTLNNLATETVYDVRVKANCGDNSSVWVSSQFYVPCIELTTGHVDVSIGTGTATSYYAPFGSFYKNSWIQMIYPASYFETAGYINSLSWEVNAANAQECSSLKIYIGTTTHANNETTTDWVSMDDLTLVYESDNVTIGSTAGWETYTLSTPYYYNGTDNLVIVTSRSSGAYKSLYYKCTGNNTNAVMYRWNDSDASYASHPGTSAATGRSANLPNMNIDYTGYICGDEHCNAPANLIVSNVTTTGATLNWEAGDATAWVLGCKAAGADEWTTVNLADNHFELTGLQENTSYNVRVMSDCGTNGLSNEAEVNFTTVANCIAPQNLVAIAHAHTVNVSWLPVDGINQYEAVVTGVNSDYSVTLNVQNGSQFDLSGLTEGEQYNIKVRALCGEEETSDWSVINFTMPTICAAPTGLALAENGQNTATLTWNPGEASSWIVECGPAGFVLGTGTQVSASENHVTLMGLNPYSYYDVYVMADCGLGYQSVWSSKFSFQTECGPITITQENPWNEDFEAYTGSGNLAFDNCWATPELTSFNSPFIYRNYTPASHSGKNTAELKGNSGAVATLVLPAFTNNLSELQFSYYGMVTGTTPGTMQLGYITDPTDASTFVEVLQVPAQSGSYNRAHSLLYGPFTFGENVPDGARITLRFTSATNNCSWNLDDFTVEMKPDCQIPTMLTVTDVTATSATLGWTAGGSEEAWNIEYGPVGFEQGTGTVVAADANPFTVTGLADATSFEFYVQANCGTTVSEYSLSAT
ncbi:MAG: fibronectin type III domain-containing protein, partial [Bacteroidales bacterium]|nr:fibronectin type III domain-containing protein [Bacteroidales bacterium]